MSIPIVTLRVSEGGSSVTCTNCGEEIYVVNRPARAGDNPLYCPGEGCGAVLKLYTEDGRELNRWWAGLDTPLARHVGAILEMMRFPSRAMAERWRRFEKAHDHQAILSAARTCKARAKESGRPITESAWGDIISRVEKIKGRAPAAQVKTDKPVVYEMPAGRKGVDQY